MIQFNKNYPIVDVVKLPKDVREVINNYCIEADLHPHNGTYVDYELNEEFPYPSLLEEWLFSLGVRKEHEKVLFKFDF